jgi:4-amino-4-deoxy-L-arabinose transferase-like glycosyltransferase
MNTNTKTRRPRPVLHAPAVEVEPLLVRVDPAPPRPRSRRRVWLTAAVLVVLAAVPRTIGLRFGEPAADARPDEELVLQEALFVLDGDPHVHFHFYPAGMIALEIPWLMMCHALGFLPNPGMLAYAEDPFPFHLATRWLAALLGTATVLATWGVARRFAGERGGFAAGFALAVMPLHVINSHFGTLDPAGTCVATLALFAALTSQAPSRRRLALAALCAGAAAAVKYPHGAVAIVPFALALRHRRFGLALAGLPAAFAAGFALLSPTVLLQPRDVWKGLLTQFDEQATFGTSEHPDTGALFHLEMTYGHGAGALFLLLALLGAAAAVKRRSRLAVALLPLVLLFLVHSIGLVYLRYLLPTFPILACLVGYAASVAPLGRRPRLAFAVFVLAAAGPIRHVVGFDRALLRQDTRAELLDLIAQRKLPRGLPLVMPAWPFINTVPLSWQRQKLVQYSTMERRDWCATRNEIARALSAGLVRSFDETRYPHPIYAFTPESVERVSQKLAGRDVLLVIPTSFDAMFEWYGQKRDELAALAAAGKVSFERVLVIEPNGGRPFPPKSAYDARDYWFVPFPEPWLVERPGPRIEIFRFRVP